MWVHMSAASFHLPFVQLAASVLPAHQQPAPRQQRPPRPPRRHSALGRPRRRQQERRPRRPRLAAVRAHQRRPLLQQLPLLCPRCRWAGLRVLGGNFQAVPAGLGRGSLRARLRPGGCLATGWVAGLGWRAVAGTHRSLLLRAPACRPPARSRASRWTTSSTSGTPSWRSARARSSSMQRRWRRWGVHAARQGVAVAAASCWAGSHPCLQLPPPPASPLVPVLLLSAPDGRPCGEPAPSRTHTRPPLPTAVGLCHPVQPARPAGVGGGAAAGGEGPGEPGEEAASGCTERSPLRYLSRGVPMPMQLRSSVPAGTPWER